MLKKNTPTVYISIKQLDNQVWFRIINYLALVTLALIEHYLNVHFSDSTYLLLIGAIVGLDVRSLTRKFIQRKLSF